MATISQRSAESHSIERNSERQPGSRPSVKPRHPLISSFRRLVHLRTSRGKSTSQSLWDKSRYVRLSRGRSVVRVWKDDTRNWVGMNGSSRNEGIESRKNSPGITIIRLRMVGGCTRRGQRRGDCFSPSFLQHKLSRWRHGEGRTSRIKKWT